jgi:hypothetical protein
MIREELAWVIRDYLASPDGVYLNDDDYEQDGSVFYEGVLDLWDLADVVLAAMKKGETA